MAEFRWILLGFGVLLLAGIWWWGARRSRRLPGDAQLREAATRPHIMGPTVMGPAMQAPPTGAGGDLESRDWGVPPFEPLNIRTAEFDPVQIADLPMTATADPLDVTLNMDYVEHEIATTVPPAAARPEPAEPLLDEAGAVPEAWHDAGAWRPEGHSTAIEPVFEAAEVTGRGYAEPTYAAPAAIEPDREPRDDVEPAVARQAHTERTYAGPATQRAYSERTYAEPTTQQQAYADRTQANSAAAEQAVPADASAAPANDALETQRIVTLRVCAMDDSSWAGSDLFAVLEGHGLQFGRYKVFHFKHSDGRSLFCAASLVEPGTFDLARMPQQEFRGLTLFAVLPGPADALYTVDTLIATAVQLADTLQARVQDAKGALLSEQGVAAMREDAARFPLSSTMT